jgi:hypothetical protein
MDRSSLISAPDGAAYPAPACSHRVGYGQRSLRATPPLLLLGVELRPRQIAVDPTGAGALLVGVHAGEGLLRGLVGGLGEVRIGVVVADRPVGLPARQVGDVRDAVVLLIGVPADAVAVIVAERRPDAANLDEDVVKHLVRQREGAARQPLGIRLAFVRGA